MEEGREDSRDLRHKARERASAHVTSALQAPPLLVQPFPSYLCIRRLARCRSTPYADLLAAWSCIRACRRKLCEVERFHIVADHRKCKPSVGLRWCCHSLIRCAEVGAFCFRIATFDAVLLPNANCVLEPSLTHCGCDVLLLCSFHLLFPQAVLRTPPRVASMGRHSAITSRAASCSAFRVCGWR